MVCVIRPSEGHFPGMLQVRVLVFSPDPQVFVQTEYSSHSSHWADTVANIKIEFFPSIDNFFNENADFFIHIILLIITWFFG